jgi:alpha-methylacyl-CoA racemase
MMAAAPCGKLGAMSEKHGALHGPLSGMRVIELASIGPGPLACMLLADLGADVVRIDRVQASGLGLAMQPEHDVNGRGRRSVALDLKAPAGRAAALRLIATADVLVEGLRPGVTESLGLGPADCQAINPGLVYGRMTGFGQTGPLAAAAGHDINYIALTGVLHAIGPAGGAPLPPLNLVGDYGGGALYLAFGVMAALYERQRSGLGQVVDAAMVDGASSLASIFHGLQAAGSWTAERGTNLLDGGAPFYGTYETADGKHISLGALEPKFFKLLAEALGLEARYVQRQYDRRLWPEMRAAMAAAVRLRSRDDWCARLEGSDACFAPVLTFAEAAQHRHAQAREAFVEVAGVLQPAPAPRFSRTPAGLPRATPAAGQHTAAVLAEAGFSTAEIAAWVSQGIAR